MPVVTKGLRLAVSLTALALASCGGDGGAAGTGTVTPTPPPVVVAPPPPPDPRPITGLSQSAAIAQINTPWSIAVLPDDRILASSRTTPGTITLVSLDGAKVTVTGLPDSVAMLDILLSPDFATSRVVYFSYMYEDRSAPRVGREKDNPAIQPQGVAIGKGVLTTSATTASLSSVQTIYRADPIVGPGFVGQPGARLAFSPDGRYLFMTSGDRQELDFNYLFDLANSNGKTIRIFPDGTIPNDNPWFNTPGAKRELWSRGHRNHYGLAFARDGVLWSSEHGPTGGDEFNIIAAGVNYGWPVATNGTLTGSSVVPHRPGDGFIAPIITWTPAIAPSGMLRYEGNEFLDWAGDFILTGLQQQGIVRVRTQGSTATEMQRIGLGVRVRSIALSPSGSLYIVTDGAVGEIRRITPVR